MDTERPLIIAHRGAKGEAPENTLAAFRLGIEQGCDAIELDVHLSKDGEIIVCHDPTLDRTTDMQGTIREMTVRELKQADAGSWFHPSFKGERIPLLEEVLDLVPAGMMINIEIKESYDREMEPALLKLIERKGRLQDVIISSFYHKSLHYLKQLEPEIKIGLLYDVDVMRHPSLAESFGAPVYSLHPNAKRLGIEDVREAVECGLNVYPYTINTIEQMKEAIRAGVSGIITDYPGRLKQLLEEAQE